MAKKAFLTQKDLLEEIKLSKANLVNATVELKPGQAMTANLIKMLVLMVNRYSGKSNYARYSWIDDMRQDALMTLCQNWPKFDEEKFNNPFAYYTTIIHYCFITYLDKERKVRNIKDELVTHLGQMPSFARQGLEVDYEREQI